ncbi:Phage Mu protein F like protein [Lutimaribacter pacificus]|uniref:Phage Mu protein F like protein n=1 Tax=Lutimaribacter pacificus TaxID=391948 RepID=A0A1H0BY50_9RHOB|nr:Phage Mu protein F like protein [Lutimaribacter pacificus]SHJ50968.1 Phage Mu protein F like protein [Lutimaribacter pacificus]
MGIQQYIWRSRDDAKVRGSHAAYDDRVFRWNNPPEGGHPGEAHNCRCYAEPVLPGVQSHVVLADFATTANGVPALDLTEAMRGLRALTSVGAALLASDALQGWLDAVRDRRVDEAGARLGIDVMTIEGRLAATAYALVQEGIGSGGYPVLPKNPEFARIGAEAAALYELMNPGTILETGVGGDPAEQRALQDFIEAAGAAFARGNLRLQDGDLAQGWVEVFPELTEDERRLGQLPGFTPERIEQWLETYPLEELGLPNHTGSPIPDDPTDNIVSTPIPDETGPNIVEARPGTITTPGGNSILPHGAKGDGQEYIGLKGHDVEQIDDIIANPRPDLSGFVEGRGHLKEQDVRLLTGPDGHWVKLDEDGNVFATSNRNLPLSHKENYPGEIIRPLEQP